MFVAESSRADGVRRVLGVDPGLTRCGWGVVDVGPGPLLRLVGVGVHRTPVADEAAQRVLALHRALESTIATFRPDAVAVERVFAQHNVRTVMATAQAGGLAMLAAAAGGVPVRWHTPSEVKAAVTGSGRADKAQVTTMVTRLLELDAPPRPADAADALALAICCAWRTPAPVRPARRPAAAGTGPSEALLAAARGRPA